jgi:hypothetical protein
MNAPYALGAASALGHSRHFGCVTVTSGLRQSTDIAGRAELVRFGPTGDIQPLPVSVLLLRSE